MRKRKKEREKERKRRIEGGEIKMKDYFITILKTVAGTEMKID